MEVRIGFAFTLSLAIVYLSVRKIMTEGMITGDVWALLLVVPLTIFIVLSFGKGPLFEHDDEALEGDWEEEFSEVVERGAGDPEESGFDVPVL